MPPTCVRVDACLLANRPHRCGWAPSEEHDGPRASAVTAELRESVRIPSALNYSVFGGWNNVVCMQLQVQFVMRNENILKIKETFFFVFTVPRVGLTPTLNLQGSFYKPAFRSFSHARRLNPWVPGSFFSFLHARETESSEHANVHFRHVPGVRRPG